jgi:hypothetical protein
MNTVKKIAFAAIAVLFLTTVFSCSQKNYGYAHNKSKQQVSASTVNPVTTKNNPVEKKYILPNKKKRILGQQKPRI